MLASYQLLPPIPVFPVESVRSGTDHVMCGFAPRCLFAQEATEAVTARKRRLRHTRSGAAAASECASEKHMYH
jgi:hypothetical protein